MSRDANFAILGMYVSFYFYSWMDKKCNKTNKS